GMGVTSAALKVGTGSRVVLGRLNRLFESVESLRSVALIQPFCTKVSLPSGRTSLIVACRSTSGVEDLTQRLTAPAPIAAVSLLSGAETNEAASPAGGCVQLNSHCDAVPHS